MITRVAFVLVALLVWWCAWVIAPVPPVHRVTPEQSAHVG
jgi:hypothetical protein